MVDLDRARKRLLAERERLLEMRRGLTGEGGTTGAGFQSTGELSTADQHPGDLGTETYEQEQTASLLARVEHELREVDAALERVEDGSYGRSVLSGEPIPEERLEALPATRYTVEEQARLERTGGINRG